MGKHVEKLERRCEELGKRNKELEEENKLYKERIIELLVKALNSYEEREEEKTNEKTSEHREDIGYTGDRGGG